MRQIFILQNSQLSFGLDAGKIYQPHKYKLYLIVNDFGYEIVKRKKEYDFYEKIINTNNFDFENVLSLIVSCLLSNNSFDVVTNSEETMAVCGKIRKFLNLDTDDYSRFCDKHVMKTRLKDNEVVSIPKYKLFDTRDYLKNGEEYLRSLANHLSFPLFIKPVNQLSSMNLTKIANLNDLHVWAKTVKPEDYYEIDEFIEGTMYHCDSYIKDNKILFTFVSRNSRPCYDFIIGKIKGTIVLPDDHLDSILLTDITEKTLILLGLPKGGVTHLEVIKTKENKVYFIEIAHRSPGCLIPKMYQRYANIDTIASHFLLQIDSDYIPAQIRGDYAAWACFPKIPGKIVALNKPPLNLESTIELEWNVNIGDEIKSYSQFGRDYTGTIFITNPSFETLYDEFQVMNENNLCEIA